MEPNWNHYFTRGEDIQSYIKTCYAEMGIADHIRFEEEVISTVWDKTAGGSSASGARMARSMRCGRMW
ncbi:hypothetical protein GCM10010909_37490 [Acidocella aquatica]|uniref:Uncharacterized protein n=1 Tax=Acidocella aquatica TaxID=1922313 RepID=A0ABQ6AA50_9PROT|nr:hypothetical protein GCM10010909_37490 [Acidocella aquatica]